MALSKGCLMIALNAPSGDRLYDSVFALAVVLLVVAQGALIISTVRCLQRSTSNSRVARANPRAELAMALAPALGIAALITFAAHPQARPASLPPAAPAYALEDEARHTDQPVQPGNPARGQAYFMRAACVTCHTIEGTVAQSNVAPRPLTHFATYPTIAGVEGLANTPDNLRRWLRNPQALKPNTAMPNLNLHEQDIEDLTAYLLTLK
ncbi:MAG: c-type cytochrome [Anaerolineae bacterium]|nr:c-type cytochrome [Anaerolineae bacterium]